MLLCKRYLNLNFSKDLKSIEKINYYGNKSRITTSNFNAKNR